MDFPHIIYGCDYNPEQWPEQIWSEDVHLMQVAGVNLVSLGIFAWSRLEPEPGKYEFKWLDRIMDLLHAGGISVNLATPTASPPPWLVRLHPEILPVRSDGTILWHGSRRHYCPHSPAYHEYADRLVTRLVEHYRDHPALKLWHVDNEYGCHISECFCNTSAEAFRVWLQERYATLDNLNNAWGTFFWSQVYSDWQEIQPPRQTPAFINPTQKLDWTRFSSQSWITCFDRQKAILRAGTPTIPVTTNFMCLHKPVDYWEFARHEDIVSNDSYPDTSDPHWMVDAGMACDLVRSLGGRFPWLLMEQAPAQVNWRPRNATKRPGVMRLGSYQAIARGADGVMFFQWRASKAGTEKFHSGMVPHAGTDTRTWREVKALGGELDKLEAVLKSQVQADVAILFDWENWWALEQDSKPSNALLMLEQVKNFYTPLFQRNITVDFAHPGADLSLYKLVIAPSLYLVTDPGVKNINSYVENGGTLLISFFSGIVDENEHIRLGGYPAPFREMLGLTIEEFTAYPEGLTNTVCTTDGKIFTSSLWSDVIRTNGCESLAAYESDYYAGMPAVTRHKFGQGLGYYLGTELELAGVDWLLGLLCAEVGIKPVLKNLPAGLEALRRVKDGKTWLFLLNHSDRHLKLSIDATGYDLLTGLDVNDSVALEPSGVVVIQY